MASHNNENTEAKGLYTFTTTEKITYTYAVPASSWEEAKAMFDENGTYDAIRIGTGDHYGGEYMGASEPRRAKLLRRVKCAAEAFTFTKTVQDYYGKETVMFVNIDYSNKLLIENIWISEYNDTDHNVENVNANGLCDTANDLLNEGWAMIPKREATHTRWGTPLEFAEEGE